MLAIRCASATSENLACLLAPPWRQAPTLQQLLEIAFQLPGAVGGGVGGEDALAGARADRAALGVRQLAQIAERVRGRAGEEDLFAGLEEAVEALPAVADDRDPAGGGLEQANAGRIAGADHVRPGDVQREALLVVEASVLRRGQMLDPLEVL